MYNSGSFSSQAATTLPLPCIQQAENSGCWERFKKCWSEPSEIEKQLIAIEADLLENWEHNQQILLNVLEHLCERGGNRHSPVGRRLQYLIQRLEGMHLDSFLKLAAQRTVEAQKLKLPMLLMSLLTLEQLEQRIREGLPGFESAAQAVAIFAANGNPFSHVHEKSFVHKLIEGVRSTLSPILSFFPNLLNVFIRAFSLENTGRAPVSVWDYSAILNIYLKVFLLPHAISVIAVTFIAVTWQAYLVTALVVAVLMVLLCIYMKWLRPCPNSIPEMDNYSEEMRKRNSCPITQRENEINEIMALLGLTTMTSHSESEKKDFHQNVVLIGPSGVGKSELFKAIAWKCLKKNQAREVNGDPIQKQLKNKKFFYINVADLQQSQFTSPVEKVINLCKYVEGYEKEVVFCLDEIQSLTRNGTDTSLLNTLKTRIIQDRPIQCIAATTKEGWEEIGKLDTDGSFVSRFRQVSITSMEDEDLLELLQDKTERSTCPVVIEDDVLQNIIASSTKVLPNLLAQPKKALEIFGEAINRIEAFDPAAYKSPDLSAKEKKVMNLQREMANKWKKGDLAALGQMHAIQSIQALKEEIRELTEENTRQCEQALTVKNLLRQLKKGVDRHLTIGGCLGRVQGMSTAQSELIMKEYLWINTYLLPAYKKQIDDLLTALPEDMYLRIDEKLIGKIVSDRKQSKIHAAI
jgi:energy-coupling factor transporter ATP-binding protein EcfA2